MDCRALGSGPRAGFRDEPFRRRELGLVPAHGATLAKATRRIRDASAALPVRGPNRLHLDRQRRELPDRRRERVPRQVLRPLQGPSRPDLRDPGEPRLVGQPERLHARALLRAVARSGPPSNGVPFSRKWLRRTLWRRPRTPDEELRNKWLAFRAEP